MRRESSPGSPGSRDLTGLRRAFALVVALCAFSCRSATPAGAPFEQADGAERLPTQRLFRAEVEARGEEATLRLTLRLWSEHRFELAASDIAGRVLWRLAVDGDRGRLDGGARDRRCRFDPSSPIDLPRLQLPVEAEALPAILLGRLPASVVPADDPEAVRIRDRRGRDWRIERAAGELVAWQLSELGGAPALTWRREHEAGGDRLRLDCVERELVVTWRERARSELTAPAPALELDPMLPDCHDLDLS